MHPFRSAIEAGETDLHTGEDGLIDEMTVMVRPRSAMLALAEAMQAEVLAAERAVGAQAPA
jgi:hypothetical protein